LQTLYRLLLRELINESLNLAAGDLIIQGDRLE
jgi:hypothetical protein